MSALAHPSIAAPFATLLQRLRRSRSLASMLPALLLSGALTFVAAAALHPMWSGASGNWIESWLTAWPIVFPIAYIGGTLMNRIAAALAARAARAQARRPGLAFADIADASRSVTRRRGYRVLRGLKAAHDFGAV